MEIDEARRLMSLLALLHGCCRDPVVADAYADIVVAAAAHVVTVDEPRLQLSVTSRQGITHSHHVASTVSGTFLLLLFLLLHCLLSW